MVGEVAGLSMLFSPIFTAGAFNRRMARPSPCKNTEIKIGPPKRADR
jgi:hypothetical protein